MQVGTWHGWRFLCGPGREGSRAAALGMARWPQGVLVGWPAGWVAGAWDGGEAGFPAG